MKETQIYYIPPTTTTSYVEGKVWKVSKHSIDKVNPIAVAPVAGKEPAYLVSLRSVEVVVDPVKYIYI